MAGLVGLETWLLVVLVAACALVSNKNEILRNNTTPQAGLLAGRCLPTWPISLKPVGGGGGAGVGVTGVGGTGVGFIYVILIIVDGLLEPLLLIALRLIQYSCQFTNPSIVTGDDIIVGLNSLNINPL